MELSSTNHRHHHYCWGHCCWWSLSPSPLSRASWRKCQILESGSVSERGEERDKGVGSLLCSPLEINGADSFHKKCRSSTPSSTFPSTLLTHHFSHTVTRKNIDWPSWLFQSPRYHWLHFFSVFVSQLLVVAGSGLNLGKLSIKRTSMSRQKRHYIMSVCSLWLVFQVITWSEPSIPIGWSNLTITLHSSLDLFYQLHKNQTSKN